MSEGDTKYVYYVPERKKWRARYWNGVILKDIGAYDTKDEAWYRYKVYDKGHHWVGMIQGPYFGFIYKMTHKATGKIYIGLKQRFHWTGPVGGYKCTDPSDDRWEPLAWKESDWHLYTSSSKDVNKMIQEGNIWDWEYEVLEMCEDKLKLHLAEVAWQMKLNVLEELDEDLSYKYLNRNIASKIFRPTYTPSELKEAKDKTLRGLKAYYLKPKLCTICGSIIPWGYPQCCKESKDMGGFKDVR